MSSVTSGQGMLMNLLRHLRFCQNSKSMWDKIRKISYGKTQITSHINVQLSFLCSGVVAGGGGGRGAVAPPVTIF